MHKHNETMKTGDAVLKKYTSHFIWNPGIVLLYTHMQIHAEHNDTMKTSDTVF